MGAAANELEDASTDEERSALLSGTDSPPGLLARKIVEKELDAAIGGVAMATEAGTPSPSTFACDVPLKDFAQAFATESGALPLGPAQLFSGMLNNCLMPYPSRSQICCKYVQSFYQFFRRVCLNTLFVCSP